MKVLIVQLMRIGDILLTTPVLPYIKECIPEAEIDFLCEPMGKSVLENNPFIHELLIYDMKHPLQEILRLRRKRYEVVLDFLNNPRTSILSRLSGAKTRVVFNSGPRSIFYSIRVPIPKEPEYVPLRKIRMVKHWLKASRRICNEEKSYRPELYLSKEDDEFSSHWLTEKKLTPKSFAVMAPAHRHPIRQWRPDGFRKVALALHDKWKMPVFLAWGPGEESLMNEIRRGEEDKIELLPPTTMRQMGAIFKNARVLVTNDSGAMHLAVAVRTPTVTIYGPTRPIDWNPSLTGKPQKQQDIAVTANDLDCLGCHLEKCPIGHLCMEKLDEVKILEACERLFKGN